MKIKKYVSVPLCIMALLLLSSCSFMSNNIACPPEAQIDWVDTVMINNIVYQYHFPDPDDKKLPILINKGNEIGKVTYRMAERACSNHKMKNGDAAFIEEDSPIYELKGYPTNLTVVADNKVYIVEENKKAKTVEELYPLEGLVKNIYIESTEDGRRLSAFSQTTKEDFLASWYKLKLEKHESLYKQGKFEGERIFIGIELKNGVSFREVYWSDTNVFSSGAVGNKKIKRLLQMNE
ncbi:MULTISPECIES: hypothetical protein [Bacillus]|uniref:hypothetical protein n=1 Tax=Bacillus TaxID=1386 RepID=UPI0002D4641E|nr:MULTISPECIES: hypothetical protein [Bacillus]